MNNPFVTMIEFHILAGFLPVAAFLLYRWPHRWDFMLALFVGLMIAFIDQHSDEVQFTVLLLATFGLFLGFQRPAHPWRFALIISVWIPLIQILKIVVASQVDLFMREGALSFVALLPAFVGAFIGRNIRSRVTNLPQGEI